MQKKGLCLLIIAGVLLICAYTNNLDSKRIISQLKEGEVVLLEQKEGGETAAGTITTHDQSRNDEKNHIYSALHIDIPWLARNDTRQQRIAGREVHMTNVMWDGERFVLYGPDLVEVPPILTNKMHTSWYYGALSSGTKVHATVSNSSLDESRCQSLIEETVVVTDPKWCGNEWHCIHDSVMPLMAAIGNRDAVAAAAAEDDSPPLKSWNISDIRVMIPPGDKKTTKKAVLFMKTFPKVISSHPLEDFPPAKNTCYRKVILGGSQRLNLYKTPTRRLCEDIKWWQKRYLIGLGLELPKREKGPRYTIKIRWIARTGSREVTNRNQVVQAIQSSYSSADKNVTMEVVYLERLPLMEQIKVFIESDIIIGPHGAGLAKLVFLRKGSGLLQLMPFGMERLPYWQYPDGQLWNKGDNFVCGIKCVNAHYRQYNATFEESGWSKTQIPDRPKGIEDPASFVYDQARTFGQYTAAVSMKWLNTPMAQKKCRPHYIGLNGKLIPVGSQAFYCSACCITSVQTLTY